MDKDWKTKGLHPNKRATILYEQRDKDTGNDIVLCGPALFLDEYYIDEDEITGEAIEGRTVYKHVTIPIFQKYYDAVLRRKEAAKTGDYTLLSEVLDEVPQIKDSVQAVETTLPLLYNGEWGSRKTPLALLMEYKQKIKWASQFFFSQVSATHGGGPFLVSLTIPDLGLKFTPSQPSKQLKTAKQQAALLALHHIRGTSNLNGTVEELLQTSEQNENPTSMRSTQDGDEFTNTECWEPVTDDKMIRKRVLQQGVGEVIPPNSTVSVHYAGTVLSEGGSKEFDSTRKTKQPLTFTLGSGGVIPGLELAVASMREKERAVFSVSYEYGYGPLGCPPLIPPRATVLFDIEVLSAGQSTKIQEDSLDLQRKVDLAKAEREEGNAWFKKGKFKKAAYCYNRGIGILQAIQGESAEEMNMLTQLLNILCLNVIRASLKMGNTDRAMERCQQVLAREPTSVKALYLKGRTLMAQQHFDNAKELLDGLLARELAATERQEVLQLLRELQQKQQG